MKKFLILFAFSIIIILLFSGCVSTTISSISGKMEKVSIHKATPISIEKIEIQFGGEGYGVFRATRITSDDTDWYSILKSHEGENVTITYAVSTSEVIIIHASWE